MSEVLAELVYQLSEKMFADTCWRIRAIKHISEAFGLSIIETMEMLRQARHLPMPVFPIISEKPKKPKQSDILIIKQAFRDMKKENK